MTHLRTPAQLEHVVTTQSTINPDGSYVFPETLDVNGLNLTPAKTGLLHAMKYKSTFRVTSLSVVRSIRLMHSSMTTRLSRDSVSCTPG
jgi:hypothetical protein